MKKAFKGYYKLTPSEIQRILDNGFISLDANVLLNLYRYSEDTRDELLKEIAKFSAQLWLTHQATYEFHRNRLSVIAEQIGIYEKTIANFKVLEKEIVVNMRSPHLSIPVLKTFKKTIEEAIKDLEKKIKYYDNLLKTDKILISITKLFSNKVGLSFSSDEIKSIEKEGEVRYQKEIPPGYKDKSKADNKFGDLIMWKELIRNSSTEKRPFILLTDDNKEDWWQIVRGKTVSPRPELSQELYLENGNAFHMYTPDRFLEFAAKSKYLNQNAIDEIRDVQNVISFPIFFTDQFQNLSSMAQPLSFTLPTENIRRHAETIKALGQFPLSPTTQLSELAKHNISDIMSSGELKRISKTLSLISKYGPLPDMQSTDEIDENEDVAKV